MLYYPKGRGVPNVLSRDFNCAKAIHPSLVPSLDEAVDLYQSAGGHLTPSTSFGYDPLAGYEDLQRARQRAMEEMLPCPEELFSYVVNGITLPFAQSIQFMIDESANLLS